MANKQGGLLATLGKRILGFSVSSNSCCAAPATEEGAAHDATVSYCDGPAPASVDACCVQDAEAKAAGQEGCGCASKGPAAACALHG